MKIIITGSLGNISRPLTIDLVKKGHSVTVISSNPEKQQEIEALGAIAAIGTVENEDFLKSTFRNADAVYCMIPLNYSLPDQPAYLRKIAKNYINAINQATIKRAVVLSGWLADIVRDENLEDMFRELKNASITFLRPAYFYSNFYNRMNLIRGKSIMSKILTLRYSGLWALLTGKTGLLIGGFGGEDKIVFVSPKDIAAAAAEELEFARHPDAKIRYVGSEEMTCSQAAQIIGTAIGKPWLKWVLIPEKQMLFGLKLIGNPKPLVKLVQMQVAMHNGTALQNYRKNMPRPGKVKLKEFAKEFADVYNK